MDLQRMRPAFLALLILNMSWAQTTNAPAFEVASIKLSPPPEAGRMRMGCIGGPGSSDPGRITCTHVNTANLITMVYGVDRYQVPGLSLADPNKFEIAAKVPEGATKEDVKLMWRNLLAERFKLVLHRETKEMPAYELVVAKSGLKIKQSVDEPAPTPLPDGSRVRMDSEGYPLLPPGVSMAIFGDKARWHASQLTLQQIAEIVGAQVNQPVLDATGLKGKYDFTLSWAGSTTVVPESDNGPTIFSALQNQLGLKLEPKKAPAEVLVIDHIEKTPTEN
jgi:uncharacterized protein (TIGR03435 family)